MICMRLFFCFLMVPLEFTFVTIGITSCVFEIRNNEYEDRVEVYYKMLMGKGIREENRIKRKITCNFISR